MTDRYGLTIQDKYEIAYARGYRLGSIEAARKCIVIFLKKQGKPSKRLIHKINREVDCRILFHIIDLVWNHSVSVEMLEDIYDTLTPPENELGEDHYNSDDP